MFLKFAREVSLDAAFLRFTLNDETLDPKKSLVKTDFIKKT